MLNESMEHRLIAAIVGGILLLTSALASAQQAAATTPAAPAPLAIPNPTYVTASFEVDVNQPAPAVWARVGKFCDIAEWLPASCILTAGVDGQLGAVRLVRGTVIEMLVGRTNLSYTYVMPVRVGVPYNAAHGTLEARPVTVSTSKLIYSFFYDNSMLADDAARAEEIANRRTRITRYLQNMKTLAEGGALPATPPRAASH